MRPVRAAGLVLLAALAACGGEPQLEVERDVVVLRPGPAPTATISADADDISDGTLAAMLHERAADVRVSRCLERAAEQYARVMPREALRLPLAASEFLLHWAGCPDPTAAVLVVQTTEPGPEPLLDELEQVLAASDFTHLGAAAAPGRGELAHRWTVFLTRRTLELRPVARTAQAGGHLPLLFRLDDGLERPRVFTTVPGGAVRRSTASEGGGWTVASVPLSEEPGEHWVEVVADGARGPEVVALFPVAVGSEPAALWRGRLLPDEGDVVTVEQAEALIERLVNDDRRRFGLPSLETDPRLVEVARAHSRDMAQRDFFGHDSPVRGGMVERLADDDYRVRFNGENVARSSSITDAHESLMRSPGHRANILSPEATRIGVGVTRARGADGDVEWVVTQEFARPLVEASPAEIEGQIRAVLGAARAATGAPALLRNFDLDQAASVAARAIADGAEGEELLGIVARELAATGAPYGHLELYTGEAFEPEDIEAPDPENVARAAAGGIGLFNGAAGVSPTTYVVLLLQ